MPQIQTRQFDSTFLHNYGKIFAIVAARFFGPLKMRVLDVISLRIIIGFF